MGQESIYELKRVDCNCNDCYYFERNIEKTKVNNTNPSIVAHKIHYGTCRQFNKEVAEIANICLLHTQDCFVFRKDIVK